MQILIIFLNSVFVMPIKMALSYLKKGKPVQAFNVIFVSSPYGFIPFIILGIYTKLWIGLLSCILFMVVSTWCRYRMMAGGFMEKKLEGVPIASANAVRACAGSLTIANYNGPIVAYCKHPKNKMFGYWNSFDDYIAGNLPDNEMVDFVAEDEAIDIDYPRVPKLTQWMIACIIDKDQFAPYGFETFAGSDLKLIKTKYANWRP